MQNATSSVSRAWVPTRMSTVPSANPASMRLRSPAPTPVGQQSHPQRTMALEGRRVGDGQAGDQCPDLLGVLLGQHLGRGHERALVPALDGGQHGGHGHHRLARAHVPLQQAVHGQRAGQIGADGGHGVLLGPRSARRADGPGTAGPGSEPRPLDRCRCRPRGGCHGRHAAVGPGAGRGRAAGGTARRRPAADGPARSPPWRLGRWMWSKAVGAVDQPEAVPPGRLHRIGEVPGPIEGLADDRADRGST